MQNRYVGQNLKTNVSKYLETQNHHSCLLSSRYHVYITDSIKDIQIYKKHVESYSALRRFLDQHQSLIFVRYFSEESGMFNIEGVSEANLIFELKKVLYTFLVETTNILTRNKYVSEELYNIFKNYILQEVNDLLDELKVFTDDSEHFEIYTSQNLTLPDFNTSVSLMN